MANNLYFVTFYDNNESGNVEHNEIYTTYGTAKRRYNGLANKLNCYSWVSLYKATSMFGRVRRDILLNCCRSCKGKDNYYHGDGNDF